MKPTATMFVAAFVLQLAFFPFSLFAVSADESAMLESQDIHSSSSGSHTKSGLCGYLSLGLGRLSISNPVLGKSVSTGRSAILLGLGLGWRGGEGLIYLQIVRTATRDYESTGWFRRDYQMYHMGFIPTLKHRVSQVSGKK